MTNKELRITLRNLYRIQVEIKNIFKYVDENTDRPFLSLGTSIQNIDQTIHEVQELILEQCDECGNIDGHDDKCSIGRQKQIEQAEQKTDDRKESQWIESQQISEGKI